MVRRRIGELVASGLGHDKAAQAALIEVGSDYWVKATLIGVIRSSNGKRDTRALRSFERALTEAGRLADPVKKWLAQMNVGSMEEVERMVLAFQHAERHSEEDRREAAALIVDDWMKTDPEAREILGRRWGFRMGVDDAQ